MSTNPQYYCRQILFISVDIQNSSKLKSENKSFDEFSNKYWAYRLKFFFDEIPALFNEQIGLIKNDIPNLESDQYDFSKIIPNIKNMEIWRYAGDEIIFSTHLHSSFSITVYLHAIIAAVEKYHKNNPDMKLKTCAWTAGFPIRNKIFTFDQSDKCEYVGLDIDLGFRLSKFASPDKLILSLDCLYFLAHAESKIAPNDTLIKEKLSRSIRFLGKFKLKGVFEEEAYPIFFISQDTQTKISSIEKQWLTVEICNDEQLLLYIHDIYTKNATFTIPFIDNDDIPRLSKPPKSFTTLMEKYTKSDKIEAPDLFEYMNEFMILMNNPDKNQPTPSRKTSNSLISIESQIDNNQIWHQAFSPLSNDTITKRHRCQAITNKGTQCMKTAKADSNYCKIHQP